MINNIERSVEKNLIQNIKCRMISESNLIDKSLANLEYISGHGYFKNNTLDTIFSLVKMIKPDVCVVIGSGSGVIPRIIREAQISSGASHNSKTYLIDLGESMGAMPNLIHNKESLFCKLYPEIIISKCHSYPQGFNFIKQSESKIDILWIDGDHSHNGSLTDFIHYSNLLTDKGIIFMHDTSPNGIGNKQPSWCGVNKTIEVINDKYNKKFEILNFAKINNFNPGSGFAIIKKKFQ